MNVCRSRGGFIKLHYKIQESDIWEDNTALVVFLKMIGLAHYEDNFTSIRFRGSQRHLKRGEFASTVGELSSEIGVPVGTLRKVLDRLEKSGRIAQSADNRQTIFSICNYAKYQDTTDKQADKQTGKQTDKQTDKPNRGLKDNKDNKEKKDYNVKLPNGNGTDKKSLFNELVADLGYSKAILTASRLTKLKARLNQFSPEQLKEVAKKIAEDPFMQGENSHGKRYGTIDYLLRNDEKIDEWLNRDDKKLTYKADW